MDFLGHLQPFLPGDLLEGEDSRDSPVSGDLVTELTELGE